ncbi:MAG: hypothetical protein ABH824_04650 [Nanoarchaeota archaeon]
MIKKERKATLSYQKILIALFVIILIIVLIVISIQIKKRNAVVGMGGFGGTPIISPPLKSISDGHLFAVQISPPVAVQYNLTSQDWSIPEKLVIEVSGDPDTTAIDNQNPIFHDYQFVVFYKKDYLEFKQAKNLVPGFNYPFNIVHNPDLGNDLGKLTFFGTSNLYANNYDTNKVTFVELTFETKKPTASIPMIKLSSFINTNTYGPNNDNAVIINQYDDFEMSIGYRMFEDIDGDGYGNLQKYIIQDNPTLKVGYSTIKGDCDDSNPLNNPACPDSVSKCGAEEYSTCSMCINPDAVEFCDGIDNNCQNAINDEKCKIPQGPELQIAVNDVFTPACGVDGDGDKDNCDPYENMLTCPKDCTTCPLATPTDCITPDLDGDGLGNGYENYLNSKMNNKISIVPSSLTMWYDMNNPDSDYDEVDDGEDFCPGTDNPLDNSNNPQYTISNGRINFNGCYTGDVGTQDQGVKPDGCYGLKDTTFSIDYYAGSGTCNSYLKK